MPPIIRSADRLFTVSENEKKQILHVFPQAAHRLKVIYPGVRSTSPSPDFPALPKRFLLFVGSLNPLKNLTLLLQALPLLSAVKDLHVVIVGATSPVFGTVGLTLDESWRERCHFLGQINQPEVLSAIYQQAEALVFPSRYESFGLPCLEAMQLGCPVLASDLPVLRETCGDAAWFFSPDNPTSLAQAIQRLLLESNARTELIGRGRQHSAQFSWSRCARALWSEIKTSLDTRSATAP
jgi:glycosyltransferase involved in cell wall biosynthesis